MNSTESKSKPIDIDHMFKVAEQNGYGRALLDVLRKTKDKPFSVEIAMILLELQENIK